MAFLILTPDQVARPLRRNQHRVEVRARLDLLEVNVEAMGEEEGGALVDLVDHALVERGLRRIRRQDRDDGGAFDGLARFLDDEAVCFSLAEAAAACASANDDVVAAVLQVQGVRPALAAIAEDSDLPTFEAGVIDI